jgi:hypothetical protein
MTAMRLLSLLLVVSSTLAMEFGSSKVPVSVMLQEKASCIDLLKNEAASIGADMTAEPYCNDVYYLRFCLSGNYNTPQEVLQAFRRNLAWRQSEGKLICDSARQAVNESFSSDDSDEWDYDKVHKRVPNAKLTKFLTPAHVQTLVTPQKDVVFVMKHGLIQDKALMKDHETRDVIDFMMYAKEVNLIVANRYSLRQDRLAFVLTANDLNGASLARGDKQFRAALNDSARLAAVHYPSLTGPTLMLNLPSWLTSVARAFAPSEVSHTLKFAQGPLKNVNTLTELVHDGPQRTQFFHNLNELVYNTVS